MTRKKLTPRKAIGLFMLGLVGLYWIAVPIVPFLDIPHKVAIIGGMVVGGEVLTVLTIAVLGAEYWGSIKQGVRRLFTPKGRTDEPAQRTRDGGDPV